MLHALIYHGWPISNSSGALERQILHSVANQIDEHFPRQKNLLINGTWLNWDFQYSVEDLMIHYRPDNVFISSMVDPWDMDQWAIEKFPDSRIYYFGNIDNDLHMNFWSIYCGKFFPNYSISDVVLSKNADNIYLCYQNKINRYRDCLYNEFVNHRLLDYGHMTYWERSIGPTDLNLAETDALAKQQQNSCVNVGCIEMWKSCLINIVSETDHTETQHTCVSEKTFKAIIGLRPYIINGDPRIYVYLKKHGFKTFDHWFPTDELKKSQSPQMTASIIARTIKDLIDQKVCLHDMFEDMKNDIIYNENRFREFVVEQKDKIDNLFTKNGI
jgi:hypothetical protein